MLDAAARVSARPSTRPTSSSSVLRSGCDLRSAAISPWARQEPAIKAADQSDVRMLKLEMLETARGSAKIDVVREKEIAGCGAQSDTVELMALQEVVDKLFILDLNKISTSSHRSKTAC